MRIAESLSNLGKMYNCNGLSDMVYHDVYNGK